MCIFVEYSFCLKTQQKLYTDTLNHALDNILYNNMKCVIKKEVAIAHVFF